MKASIRTWWLKKDRGIALVYSALILLSFHWYLVMYIDSSFLGKFMSESALGLLFTLGSVILFVVFIYFSRILKKLGNFRLALVCTIIEIAALLGMALSTELWAAVLFFLLHFVTVPLIYFNLDIFLEELIGKQESQTGSKRGLYLALYSLAGAAAPLTLGYLIVDNTSSFAPAYIASALLLLPLIIVLVLFFKNFKDPLYTTFNLKNMMRTLTKNKNVRYVCITHTLLQIFFTWMVIYTPLYLAKVAGFGWTEIGYIMFAGIMAYVIFEYPIGIIADKYIGEKEMMALGFLIIAISTSWFAFLPQLGIGIWMLAMFLTRVGASLVEATTESYFFKQTQGDDADKISLFRMTRPFASVVGALLGSLALIHFEFSFLFIILGFLMVPGIFFTLLLKDTR